MGLAGFRVALTGTALELDAKFEVVKKLKLVGYPDKIFKKTAFIKGMFNSDLEVLFFFFSSLALPCLCFCSPPGLGRSDCSCVWWFVLYSYVPASPRVSSHGRLTLAYMCIPVPDSSRSQRVRFSLFSPRFLCLAIP